MCALALDETKHELQNGIGKRQSEVQLGMVLTATRTIKQEVLNNFENDKHIEGARKPNAQQTTAFVQQDQLERPQGLLKSVFKSHCCQESSPILPNWKDQNVVRSRAFSINMFWLLVTRLKAL